MWTLKVSFLAGIGKMIVTALKYANFYITSFVKHEVEVLPVQRYEHLK